MASGRLERNLKRFAYNCIIVVVGLLLVLIAATVVVGLRVQMTEFPSNLGNTSEKLARVAAASDPNDFTFLVVGDVKSGTATFEALLDVVGGDRPAFAAILGDLVGHPMLISHRLFAVEVAEYARHVPMFVVPGNHDIHTDGPFRLEEFENLYGPAQFCFAIGQCLFVFLNDIAPYAETGDYLKFLEQAVSSNRHKADKIFVFMHVPPSGLDSSVISSGLPGSDTLFSLASKYNIDYVFAGDHHGYVKARKDKTTYIVTGGGGARLRGARGRFHHMVSIAVKNDEITETVMVTRRHLETLELLERNIAVYFWPLIVHDYASVTATGLIFAAACWILLSAARRLKQIE